MDFRRDRPVVYLSFALPGHAKSKVREVPGPGSEVAISRCDVPERLWSDEKCKWFRVEGECGGTNLDVSSGLRGRTGLVVYRV